MLYRLLLLSIFLILPVSTITATPNTPPSGKQNGGVFSLFFINIPKVINAPCGQGDSLLSGFNGTTSSYPLTMKCILLNPFLTQYLLSNGSITFLGGNTTVGAITSGNTVIIYGNMVVKPKKAISSVTTGSDSNSTVISKGFFTSLIDTTKAQIPNCGVGFVLRSSGMNNFYCVETIVGKGGSASGSSFYTSEILGAQKCVRGTVQNLTSHFTSIGGIYTDGYWTWTCKGSGGGRTIMNLQAKLKIDGDWTDWNIGSYGGCSSSCGYGSMTRKDTRTCTQPSPKNGGKDCIGNDHRYQSTSCYESYGCPPPANQ